MIYNKANICFSRQYSQKSKINNPTHNGGLEMSSNHFNTETRRDSRLFELDLLKAVAIIAMILCHAVSRLGIHNPGYENEFLFFLGEEILGDYLCVAHAFMFAMGVGIVYSRKSTPKNLILRGVKLYLLGYLLNFLRYGMYNLGEGIITGEFRSDLLKAFLGMDILHFAGLALIVTGVLKLLKLREVHLLAIAGVLSLIGSVIPVIDTGNFAGNWFIGHFVTTNSETCCFVFFNWYIFVAAGMIFGKIIRGIENRDRLYKRLLIISCCVMAVYITLTFCFGTFFLSKNHDYYSASLPEAAGLLSIDLSFLSAFYFLLKLVPAEKLSVFIDMSRNITSIYFIHWCILGFLDCIVCYLFEVSFPWPVIYLIGVVLIVLSSLIAKLWASRKRFAKVK